MVMAHGWQHGLLKYEYILMNILAIKHTTDFFQKELAKYSPAVFFQKYKANLTPRFCFENLYAEGADRVYYNEIIDYYRPAYSLDELVNIHNTVLFNLHNKPLTYKEFIYKRFCNGDCDNCGEQKYCF
jgi:hypothetical protein